MSLMDVLENAVLDEMLGASATLFGASVDIALSTTTPTDAGGNITEPNAGYGYARVSVTNNGTEWPAASSGEKKNANTILFAQASGGAWGDVTHFVIYDGATPKIWGALDNGAGTPTPRTIADGDQFRFLANQLRITID